MVFKNYLHILLRNKIKSIVPRATFEGRFGISLLYLRIQLLSLASNRFFQRGCFGIHHNLCFLCFLPHSFQHKNMVLTIEFTCSWEIKWSQLCQGNIVLCCAILNFHKSCITGDYWEPTFFCLTLGDTKNFLRNWCQWGKEIHSSMSCCSHESDVG